MKDLQVFLSEERKCVLDFKGCSISILENPKAAFLAEENRDWLDKLLGELQVLTAESFGTELDRHSCDGVRNHVVDVDSLAFLHNGNKVLGFASSRYFSQDRMLFYLHGVAIANTFKGNGGSIALMQSLMDLAPYTRVAFTTQNPVMFCVIRNMCNHVHPSPNFSPISLELSKLGANLINGRSGSFNQKTFVNKDLYGSCLYDGLPKCRDEDVDRWFIESLGADDRRYTKDAFLFIGEKSR